MVSFFSVYSGNGCAEEDNHKYRDEDDGTECTSICCVLLLAPEF
jgi:hypothetical protein